MYLKSILLGYCKIGFLVTAKSEAIDVPDSLISLKYGSVCALNQTIERHNFVEITNHKIKDAPFYK